MANKNLEAGRFEEGRLNNDCGAELYDGKRQYTEHFIYNLPAFKDKRYLTVDGKPIFMIWNPIDHPEDISLLIEIWRKLAEKNGLKGIHFVGGQKVGTKYDTLMAMGFDAVYQSREGNAFITSEEWTLGIKAKRVLHKYFHRTTHPVADFGERYLLMVSEAAWKKNVYPTLLAGYDRSPRAGKDATIFYNFTPETWRKHIKDVLSYVKEKDDDHNIIMLKSWNEWGEGNHMEPDLKYGTAMLDVLEEEFEAL